MYGVGGVQIFCWLLGTKVTVFHVPSRTNWLARHRPKSNVGSIEPKDLLRSASLINLHVDWLIGQAGLLVKATPNILAQQKLPTENALFLSQHAHTHSLSYIVVTLQGRPRGGQTDQNRSMHLRGRKRGHYAALETCFILLRSDLRPWQYMTICISNHKEPNNTRANKFSRFITFAGI